MVWRHLSLLLSVREYVMRRCSRNWRRTRWKASPRFSPWPTSAPGPLRAAHGTQPPKTESPRLVAPELPSRAVARKRKNKNRGRGGPRLEPQLLRQQHQLQQRQLGARMRTASARARRVAMVVHAQFIPQLATAPLTTVRSRNSRSRSVGGVSRPSRTAHPLLASGLARRKPPTVRPLPWRRGWGTNPLLEN